MAKVKKMKNGLLIFLIIVIILLVAGIAGYVYFQADEITYVGSSHYSAQEMNEKIFGSDKPNVVLYKLFGNKKKTIPLIQKYEVEVQGPRKL